MRRMLRRFRVSFWRVSLVTLVLAGLFFPVKHDLVRAGDTVFIVSLNGTEVGVLPSRDMAASCLRQARREVARSMATGELSLTRAELSMTGQELMVGSVDDEKSVTARMVELLEKSRYETLARGYTVKIGTYSVNLASREEVQSLLTTALERFDTEGAYRVDLVQDTTREVNVLTTQVTGTEENPWQRKDYTGFVTSGVDAELSRVFREAAPITFGDSIEDYYLGVLSMDFGDKVEVVEGYLPESSMTSHSLLLV